MSFLPQPCTCDRSGSLMRFTFTVDPSCTLPISWGVMRIYCFLSDEFAVSIYTTKRNKKKSETSTDDNNLSLTIILIEIRRLTASMNTSNSSIAHHKVGQRKNKNKTKGHHSPKHLSGHPIDSQSDNNRQIVEKDFSPPLSDLGSFSRDACVPIWSSVCTLRSSVCRS